MGLRSKSTLGAIALAFCLVAFLIARQPAPTGTDSPALEIDHEAFFRALKPKGQRPPIVVVLALNSGTETTDFLVPYAVLQRAGVAKVIGAAPKRGRVTLMPALEVELDEDIAAFDRTYPSGADYVIVPAMHLDDDPAVLAFIRAQSSKGATIIGVCSGARVLGKAGLLDGRKFTGHWYDRSDLLKSYPQAVYVPNQRYLVDRGVVTTTGVTATLPASLALVEAIGGHDRAAALAQELGLATWDTAHDSAAFELSTPRIWTYVSNTLAFWRQDEKNIQVQDDADDVQLAFAADAWSRTHLVSVKAVAGGASRVRLRSGLALIPASNAMIAARPQSLPLSAEIKPAEQLNRTLCEISREFGAATRDLVALEMEYPVNSWAAGNCGVSIGH